MIAASSASSGETERSTRRNYLAKRQLGLPTLGPLSSLRLAQLRPMDRRKLLRPRYAALSLRLLLDHLG